MLVSTKLYNYCVYLLYIVILIIFQHFLILNFIYSYLALTIRNNGSILIPCYPSGVVYDLFECLTQNLDNAGLVNVPMFFISPVADSSLAYANILAEWLSSSKQNKVYLPDDPFPHGFYLRNSRLKYYNHVFSDGFSKDFRQVNSLNKNLKSFNFENI